MNVNLLLSLMYDKSEMWSETKRRPDSPRIELRIKEIDGVNVKCVLVTDEIDKVDTASFTIYMPNIMGKLFRFEMVSAADRLTEFEILQFLTKINEEILPNLILKKNGKLDYECEDEDEEEKGECSMCDEITQTKPPCNHWLCNRCLSKIAMKREMIRCSMCEQILYYCG